MARVLTNNLRLNGAPVLLAMAMFIACIPPETVEDAGPEPDAGACACAYVAGVCEAAADGTTEECICDTDCGGAAVACGEDGSCDVYCDPEDTCVDPDCDTVVSECDQ